MPDKLCSHNYAHMRFFMSTKFNMQHNYVNMRDNYDARKSNSKIAAFQVRPEHLIYSAFSHAT